MPMPMLPVLSVALVAFGLVVLFASALQYAVMTQLFEGMSGSGSGTGVIRKVSPNMAWNADGTPVVWYDCVVSMETGGETIEASMWLPEWYEVPEAGSEIRLAYDPDGPRRCMAAELQNAVGGSLSIGATISFASVVAGLVLSGVAAVTGR